MERQLEVVRRGAFLHIGPLTTDIAPGYDISHGIGAAMIGWYGTACLCYVDAQGDLGLPTATTSRSASSPTSSQRPRRRPGERPPRRQTPRRRAKPRRFDFRWRDQFNRSLDPDTAEQYHDQTLTAEGAKTSTSLHVRAPNLLDEDQRRSQGVRPLNPPGPGEGDQAQLGGGGSVQDAEAACRKCPGASTTRAASFTCRRPNADLTTPRCCCRVLSDQSKKERRLMAQSPSIEPLRSLKNFKSG